MLANPPYGVDWKAYADPIKTEAETKGFDGRFGAGLPRISDGSLLFLQHMLSKMKPVEDRPETAWIDGGSRIAIVLSGSPLFSGGAGSGRVEIRRWIIENDWLEGIVALPDQMFYNTGISTYVWILTNRKTPDRAGRVVLVDGRDSAPRCASPWATSARNSPPRQSLRSPGCSPTRSRSRAGRTPMPGSRSCATRSSATPDSPSNAPCAGCGASMTRP